MYIFMGDLTYNDTKPYEDQFWAKNRIDLRQGWVDQVDLANKSLLFRHGHTMTYDQLVVATGSKPNRFGWPGEDLEGVQSLYSLQDLDVMELNVRNTQHAVIVGGGLIGVEVAEMLLTRGVKITYLVRENHFWNSVLPEEEAQLVDREIRRHAIDLRLNEELQEILPDPQRRVRAVITKTGEEIPCQMVVLTTGVSPNIGMLQASGLECDRGVLVDQYFKTSADQVWAGGDCAQHRQPPAGRRAIEPVWYTGRIHGEHIAANLLGDQVPYKPGLWFNSAKFFDIEYQTYGDVPSRGNAENESFYWEDPSGRKSLRINFTKATGVVTGVNAFGIRHRHTVWEQWMMEGQTIEQALSHLGAVNFDPEFFKQYERDIVNAFNARFPERTVTLVTKKGLFSEVFQKFRSPTPNALTGRQAS